MLPELSPQIELLIQGFCLFAQLAFATMILGKSGRSPYFAVLAIIPYAILVAIWVFAFTRWPKRD